MLDPGTMKSGNDRRSEIAGNRPTAGADLQFLAADRGAAGVGAVSRERQGDGRGEPGGADQHRGDGAAGGVYGDRRRSGAGQRNRAAAEQAAGRIESDGVRGEGRGQHDRGAAGSAAPQPSLPLKLP